MRNFIDRIRVTLLAGLALQLALAGCIVDAREAAAQAPSQRYGELFERVQIERIFADSKTFADAIAKAAPEEIMRRYAAQQAQPGFSLRDFVAGSFEIPVAANSGFQTAPREELRAHVSRLWPVLTREPRAAAGTDSLLPLSASYVVPGGRFREMYYWDSYFTMVGLQAGGRHDLVADMVENFAGLIDRYGHIPNGNRSYYLSRSQPPFFAAMVELQASHDGTRALLKRLPQLEREYAFWMAGADTLAPGSVHRRVVRLPDGTLLNRHWDDNDTPRDEAWLEDIATAKQSSRPAAEVYRDLRAAAESGWDFSSRWFADGKTLSTIRTTDILPVDLNSLLYKLERVIASGCEAAKRLDCARKMTASAQARQKAVLRLMWDPKRNAFVDYDWRNQQRLPRITAAATFPVFVDLADGQEVQRLAITLRATLLKAHGLAATTESTGQQWDAPNGWAPLQWVAIDGLRRHGQEAMAADIAERWVAENARVYCKSGKLVEKYDVVAAGEGAGGEYPVQDGFGWTNGVLIKLLAIYPKLSAGRYEFTGAGC